MSLTLSGGFDSPTQQANILKKELLKTVLSNELQISKEALQILLKTPAPKERLDSILEQLKQKNTFLILPTHLIQKQQPIQKTLEKPAAWVEVVLNYERNQPIGDIKDISKYLTSRYSQFKKYLQYRLTNVQSIINVKKINNEKASFIGLVFNKKKTHRGNIILEIEDLTGTATAIINRSELIQQAEDLLFDEVIGITGTVTKGAIFVEEITQPDLPIKREERTTTDEVYAAFLSDIHIGSKKFLGSKFEALLDFLSGKSNSDISWDAQSDILDKLKYIFVAGDVVDGIGIYPGQEKELEIKDIYAQYSETAKKFGKIPNDLQIIICPGNHDYVRLAQPQPPIEKETAPELYELPNTTLVSSPGVVKVHPFDQGGGINVLLYHGVSIDTIVPVSSNLKDGYKHPEKVMLALLKKRHLSPQYESGIVGSLNESDPMAIPEYIDLIHTGHVHSNGALNYRGVTMINSGTWQGTTEFQKFLGHEPTPARLPILNLKTRQLRMLEF